jgi:glycosyltransferase involved in cell wall biosynthesis
MSKSNQPLVSVIVPTYNSAKYIRETLTSIFNQDYPNLEVIVVDKSDDNTPEIVQEFDVVYIKQENKGKPAAMNIGIKAAKGDYISALDSDDLWLPEKTSTQMRKFKTNTDLDVAFCYVQQFLCPTVEDAEQKFFIPENSEILSGYTSIAMLIKKEALDKVGEFDEEYTFGDFIQWYGRAKDLNLKEAILDDVLVKRRIHKSNMGGDQMAAKLSYMKAIKERLMRNKANKS